LAQIAHVIKRLVRTPLMSGSEKYYFKQALAIGPKRQIGLNHSRSFDHRRRPETFLTAIATAFFCPSRTTTRLPRGTPATERISSAMGVSSDPGDQLAAISWPSLLAEISPIALQFFLDNGHT
jgi:hypothetical protein